MSFGYYNNNNKIAVQTGSTVDSSFNTFFKGTDIVTVPNTGFNLNGVDIANYITPFSTGFGTANNYGFTVNGVNLNTLFSFTKPTIGFSLNEATFSGDANYKYYAFTTASVTKTITMNFRTNIDYSFNIEALLIGGGGSGSNLNIAGGPGVGGGGAGTYVTASITVTPSILSNSTLSFSAYIGAGGAGLYGGGGTTTAGNYGGVSQLTINSTYVLTAGGGEGGHRGYNNATNTNPNASGSAGGAGAPTPSSSSTITSTAPVSGASYTITPSTPTYLSITPYRNNGGTSAATKPSISIYYGGGGGGGAGGAGAGTGTSTSGGNGGAGKTWINGKGYAGGGGGLDTGGDGGQGGYGGTATNDGVSIYVGGAGANIAAFLSAAQPGAANTGSGGGASWVGNNSGEGGSGICILAIPIAAYNKYFQ